MFKLKKKRNATLLIKPLFNCRTETTVAGIYYPADI